MPRSRVAYPPEFRQKMVELAQSGRSPEARKENRKLRVEREILAKATAWFAREADTTLKKSSGS